ncbi:MAG: hypothetical protein DYH05_05295 [Acidobacteria bacterium ACB1]|nr:hypothetical protein [Pyrinomonadaceae bacterium]MCE7961900.1 hypothetical protein [Acidobacteria bacterium ACB1]
MASDLAQISTRSARTRIVIAVAIVVVFSIGWMSVRREFGSMIAEMTPPTDPAASQLLDSARSLAPGDPMTYWLASGIERQSFSPESAKRSMNLMEEAVKLSPYDYRWWIELGRASEQAGNAEQAEAAFQHAVDLAPSYTIPRWQVGNFYIRKGDVDKAKPELKLATVNNYKYRLQVFGLAWDYFDHDPQKVEELASDGPDVLVALTMFYAQRGQPADALRIWNKLSEEDKAKFPQISSVVVQGLYDKRAFPQALEFSRQLNIDADAQPEAVSNPGFERIVNSAEHTYFGWQFPKQGKVDVNWDGAVKHSGSKSLRLNFKGFTAQELFTASQLVVVKPSKKYRLTFWARTENLRSAGPPQVDVTNAVDDRLIVSSQPMPQGTNDWQQITVEFTTPENCNAISIRTTRVFCGDGCPLLGSLWYDDFELTAQ